MTETEAKSLKVKDRVVFDYEGWHPSVGGTVIEIGHQEFAVKWDDGQIGYVPFKDADQHIHRL